MTEKEKAVREGYLRLRDRLAHFIIRDCKYGGLSDEKVCAKARARLEYIQYVPKDIEKSYGKIPIIWYNRYEEEVYELSPYMELPRLRPCKIFGSGQF